jgi:hypothetical protein
MTRGGKRFPVGGRPPREDGPTRIVSARLSPADHADLSAIADAVGVSLSALAAAILRGHLEERRADT